MTKRDPLKVTVIGPSAAAKVLGVSLRTFQRMVVEERSIPRVIVGKRYRYVRERLLDWALNRERSAT